MLSDSLGRFSIVGVDSQYTPMFPTPHPLGLGGPRGVGVVWGPPGPSAPPGVLQLGSGCFPMILLGQLVVWGHFSVGTVKEVRSHLLGCPSKKNVI